jgi:hypothetical protein
MKAGKARLNWCGLKVDRRANRGLLPNLSFGAVTHY